MIRGSVYGIVLLGAVLCGRVAWSEISTDVSFGPKQVVAPVANEYLISEDLGGRSGVNLFHSFSLFNVEEGYTANFSATLPTERVIARVTGGTRSQIDGRLRTSGSAVNADLFLLNPFGVTFGEKSTLDLRGSFYVSTAHQLRFESGPDFDTTSSAPDPPLSIAAPAAFGFLTDSPERIRFNQTIAGFTLPAGETFSIIGGKVSLTGFNRTAIRVPSGRIQIASVDRASEVPLDLAGFGGEALAAAVTVDEDTDVTLEQGFFLDVGGDPATGGPAGQVVIRGGSLLFSGSRIDAVHPSLQDATGPAIDIEMVNGVELREASRLTSQASGAGRGPDISIDAPKLNLHGRNTIVQTQSLGTGAGGTLRLAGDSIEISDGAIVRSLAAGSAAGGALVLEAMQGVRVVSGGSLLSSASAGGEGGATEVGAPFLEVADGGFILSESRATGPGGALVIHADRIVVSNATDRDAASSILTLALAGAAGGALRLVTSDLEIERGGSVTTRADADGPGGALEVLAADRVVLRGVDAQGRPASLRAFTLSGSSGAGGSLSVAARTVEVDNGGQMSTLTQGTGDAGALTVDATESFTVSGGPNGPSLVSADSRRVIGGPTEVPGGGGDLTVRTGLFTLRDGGQVSASTEGMRDSGKIRIEAGEVVVSGVDPVDPVFGNASGVFSRSNADIEDGGDARGIEIITTGDALISDRGVLSSSTVASGNAGPIRVEAGGRIRLDKGASISARAEGPFTGNGGSVDLVAAEGVFLNNSSILAESQGSGLAGDVTIDAGPRFEAKNSTVKTEARFGSGGRITIIADEIVWLQNSALTTTVRDGAGGGGDISIDPEFVVLDQSQILARAETGAGGNITITAGTFFQTPDSVLDASSELGIDGTVSINAPDTDVTSGITTLPSDVLDATALMRTACSAATAEAGSFVVSGRHPGLPVHPDGLLAAFDAAGGPAAVAAPGPASEAAARVALAGPFPAQGCSRAQEEVL